MVLIVPTAEISQLNEEYFFFPNFSQQLAKSCSVYKLHTSNLCK